ncbi:HipA family kinase [Miltoncostaea marina]|uniref:HipA family kinase n=1 Tax=Miltoncostaea marina TaxID=2843215 RepID=UPI001C3C7817|nr:HipA family kinase [Miltoncostaea marina]
MSGPPAPGPALTRVAATRYVTPLREGGSLPALVEADDDGLYVLKFRGAGQGPKVLVAEILAGEIARELGLPMPEIVLVDLDPALGGAEPDPEIHDLLRASRGVNVGLDYLPGSLPYDPADGRSIDPALAAEVVWLDALLTNVDRTASNPNLLVWHERLWLIDHGAALYAHHGDPALGGAWGRPFPAIAQHVLLDLAGSVAEADARLAPRLDPATIERVVDLVPDELLDDEPGMTPAERRAAYRDHLTRRAAAPRAFVREAEDARGA